MSWFDRIRKKAQESTERKKYFPIPIPIPNTIDRSFKRERKYNEGATAPTPTITIGTGFVNGLQREGEYGFEFGAVAPVVVAVRIDIDNNWSD